MGQTSHGIPYPVGTDRLMDGDDSIKALAEFVDAELFNRPRGHMHITAAASGTLAYNAWTNFGGGFTYGYTKGGVVAVTPSGLRVPKDGLYRVTGQVYYSTASASGPGNRRGVRVHINSGTSLAAVEGMVHTEASVGPVTAHASNDVELHANDTLYLAFYHNQTGANLTAVGLYSWYTFMSVHYLAALT